MRTYQDFAGIRLSNDPLAKPRVTVGGNSTRATKLTVYHIRDAVEVIYSLCTGPPPPPSHFSRVRLCATPRTAAYQAPPSMGFSRQEYWSGVPLPSPMYRTATAAKSLQSCPTLCDPIDGSPPGSPVPGILQARVLEWGAIGHF